MPTQVISKDEGSGNITASVSQMTYSGPLPHPSDMAAYKKVLPNAPERIMVMAEKEQANRHSAEQKLIQTERRESLLGQCFAFVIVLLCLASSVYLAMNDKEWVAGSIIGVTATLAVIFYLNKEPENKQ